VNRWPASPMLRFRSAMLFATAFLPTQRIDPHRTLPGE
jgi:hypothetical protein